MIRKFVRSGAVKSWSKELDAFLEWYASQSRDMQADYFIYAVRTRAGFQHEGMFTLPDSTKNIEPELMAYPIMIDQFQKFIDHFNGSGNHTEAACLSIWVHTLRSFLYPELQPAIDRLWHTIMLTKDLWPEMLKQHYQKDVAEGLDTDLLKNTYGLSVAILKTLPPQNARGNNVH